MVLALLTFSDWALLVLRLVIAAVFLAHGWPKLKDLKTAASTFGMMGFRPGWLWGTVAAVLEAFGGLLLLVGLWTQVLGLLFAVEMLVAGLWKLSKGQGLVDGYELDLSLLAGGLVLATMGGGAYALGF